MHGILTYCLSVVLLSHAALGCAWHDSQGAKAIQSPAGIAAADACCDHDHAAHKHRDSSSAPCNCRLECRAKLAFLPTPKQLMDDTRLVLAFDFADLDMVEHDDLLRGECARCQDSALNSLPPLRLHLLHQSLLI